MNSFFFSSLLPVERFPWNIFQGLSPGSPKVSDSLSSTNKSPSWRRRRVFDNNTVILCWNSPFWCACQYFLVLYISRIFVAHQNDKHLRILNQKLFMNFSAGFSTYQPIAILSLLTLTISPLSFQGHTIFPSCLQYNHAIWRNHLLDISYTIGHWRSIRWSWHLSIGKWKHNLHSLSPSFILPSFHVRFYFGRAIRQVCL